MSKTGSLKQSINKSLTAERVSVHITTVQNTLLFQHNLKQSQEYIKSMWSTNEMLIQTHPKPQSVPGVKWRLKATVQYFMTPQWFHWNKRFHFASSNCITDLNLHFTRTDLGNELSTVGYTGSMYELEPFQNFTRLFSINMW
jgi:hypothetical protein